MKRLIQIEGGEETRALGILDAWEFKGIDIGMREEGVKFEVINMVIKVFQIKG